MQKINGLKLNTFEMEIVFFIIKNQQKKFYFFNKIFILADINIVVVL